MSKSKAQHFIKKEGEFKPVTKREFLKQRDDEVKNNYVHKLRLIENKQYTKHQLDTLEKQGLLTPLKHNGKIFFPKEQLIKIIDSEPLQRQISF